MPRAKSFRAPAISTGEPSACNHKGQHLLAAGAISLAFGSLKQIDYMVANSNGIEQSLEVKGGASYAFKSQVITDRAKGQH